MSLNVVGHHKERVPFVTERALCGCPRGRAGWRLCWRLAHLLMVCLLVSVRTWGQKSRPAATDHLLLFAAPTAFLTLSLSSFLCMWSVLSLWPLLRFPLCGWFWAIGVQCAWGGFLPVCDAQPRLDLGMYNFHENWKIWRHFFKYFPDTRPTPFIGLKHLSGPLTSHSSRVSFSLKTIFFSLCVSFWIF